MPSPNRRWIPPILILLATIASGIVGGRLPSDMTLPFGALLPFSTNAPAETAPRWLVLGLMPALALALWVVFRLAPTPTGRRLGRRLFHHAPDEVTSPDQFARFGNTYEAIVLGVVGLVLGLHAAVLAAALEAPAIAARLVPAVIGGSLVLMGNVMPRLRPNWVAGLRSERLLADPQLWRATHRVFGAAFVVGGLLTIATAVVAPRFGVFVAIGAVVVSCVVGFAASRRIGGRASSVAVALLCVWAPALGAKDAPASVAESPSTFTSDGRTRHGPLARPRGMAGGMPVALRAQSDAGVFRLYQGQAEIGREVFRIEARAIESTVTFPMGGVRIQSRVEYDADGRAESASMAVMGLSGDTVRQSYSASRAGDSLRLTMSGASSRTWARRSDAEMIAPDQSLAPFLRLVMAERGRARDVSVWLPNADSTFVVALSWRGHTADVAIGPQRWTFVVGADGRVVRGTILPGGFRYERYVGDPTQLPPLAGLTRPAPDYSAPADAPFSATEVQVPVRSAEGDTFALACTFTVPRAGGPRWPAVVTSTGSGQQDRDETLWPLLPEYRLFRQVAERLAREQIAVLRCDDRGVGGSGGALMSATTEDFAGDVVAQVTWLRSRADVDIRRIAIVGHSEGGLIGPMVAARDTQLAAIVVLAGAAKPGREVLRDQFVGRVEADTTMAPAQRAAAIASAGQAMEAFIAANAWTRWFADYDPRVTARQVRQPVLILHPALDQQVSVGQADTLAAALRAGGNRDVTVRVFPGLNHLFLRSLAGTGDMQEYAALKDMFVSAEVLDALATWLRSRLYH